jgi:diguanylate cyclase (GGDEF)-like protein
MDDFKMLNDSLGHDKGDQLLQQIAGLLLTCVREGDTVARLGGDEFVVLLEDLSKIPQEAATQAEVVARKIHHALRQPYQLNSHTYHSSASIGITLFGGTQRESIEEPLKRAELAMYKAKAIGRDNLRFFEPEMRNAVNARVALEADLHEAVTQSQFLLYYQAQVDRDAHLTGVEALVRWQHPKRGLILPGEFIPVAEASGLILPLGHWVLETACKQLAAWAVRPEMAHLTISVNVSARQFRWPDFVDDVLAVLDATAANPRRLQLELTESLLLDNMKDIIAKMNTLKSKGVGFSLDDFGTGYSSLSYLKRLPLDELKIDQSFVRDILTDPNDAAIAKMVVALAESMGLAVIAEGVETQAQRDALDDLGCQAFQGYLFSRPVPIEEFEALAGRA